MFSSFRPISSETTWPPVRIAMSPSMALRRSPKPGALTATDLNSPRILLTTSVASASPSTSSAMMTSGLPDCTTLSSSGSMSLLAEILELTTRMYGSSRTASSRSGSVTKYGAMYPLSKRMPSVSSSSRPKVLLSSTVMTPSLPTLSMASAIISPIAGSPAEMDAVEAICSLVSTSLASLDSSSLTASTAASMPRLSAIGLAPAATLRRPSRTSAWASTVAVAGHVVGLLRYFLDQLGADLLIRVLELDLLGDGHAIVGDRGGSPLLLENHVPALGAESDLNGVGKLVHAALEAAPGVLVKRDHLRCHLVPVLRG